MLGFGNNIYFTVYNKYLLNVQIVNRERFEMLQEEFIRTMIHHHDNMSNQMKKMFHEYIPHLEDSFQLSVFVINELRDDIRPVLKL